jgi:glyoxylase-like metal-dependent hydrolase (beta-lactamase superfamily II)
MEHKRPPLQKEIAWTDLGNGIINFSTPPVGFQQYLILGTEKALLVDTGMGIGSLKQAVSQVTDLPVIVVNTHCHPDHAGGNAEFDPALINPADLDVFERMATKEFRIQDVSRMPDGTSFVSQLQPTGPKPVFATDGQLIDLGGRTVQLIFTPGHTHGSLCVFDLTTGALFTGDNVQANATALVEWNATSVEEFYASMEKLAALPITRILGGHRPNDNPPDLLQRKMACAKQILNGAKGTPHEHMGQISLAYEWEGTAISYREDHIYKAQ